MLSAVSRAGACFLFKAVLRPARRCVFGRLGVGATRHARRVGTVFGELAYAANLARGVRGMALQLVSLMASERGSRRTRPFSLKSLRFMGGPLTKNGASLLSFGGALQG